MTILALLIILAFRFALQRSSRTLRIGPLQIQIETRIQAVDCGGDRARLVRAAVLAGAGLLAQSEAHLQRVRHRRLASGRLRTTQQLRVDLLHDLLTKRFGWVA